MLKVNIKESETSRFKCFLFNLSIPLIGNSILSEWLE